MKNLDLFIKTNVFVNKLIACLVFFCLVMTSTCLVNNFSQSMIIDETIQASAGTIFVQFFYISTLPANLISKMFLETQVDPITNTKNSNKNNKNSAESNSAKASVGFSILPTQMNISKVLETKNAQINKYVALVKTTNSCSINHVYSCLSCVCKSTLGINIIMMLLLAILISRRNIGDDNIIINNIKNNYLAQLI